MAGSADGKSTFVFDGESKEFKSAVKDVLKGLKATDAAGKKTVRTFAAMKKEFADADALDKWHDSLEDVNDELGETPPAAKAAGASIKGMASELGPYAAAATVAAASVLGLVSSASQLTDEIRISAGQTGTMVETMTAMRFAAIDGGSSADTMTESITALAGRIKEARKGSDEAKASFVKYGVTLDNVNGTARTTDAILRDVLDTVAAQGTQSAKTEAAISLMNESAGKVPAIFDKGAESLDEWTKKAEVQAIAAAVSEGKLDDYNTSMAELSLAADAAKVMLGEKLLPAVVAVTKGVTEVVGPVASLLGTLWETGEALNTVNPLYWLLKGALSAVAGAAELAHAATVKLGLSLSEEEKAAEAAAAAWKAFDDELVAGFETQEQADAKALVRREERRKAFKLASEEEIKLNEKRATIARQRAAEAAKMAAEEAKAAAELQKIREDFTASSIEGVQMLADAEEASFHDRVMALEAIRDNVQEEIAVRAAALSSIEQLNEEKAASDIESASEAFEHWKELEQERHEEMEALAATEAEAAALAIDERKALTASWRDQAIEAASAVTSMILDSIQQQRQAEADLDKARIDGRIANLQSQETLTEKQVKSLERLETKRKALMLAEFKRGKEATLVAIGLATLQAMAVAATAAIPPANLPFIAAAAAIGAGQLGLAASTKPPALAHDGGKVQAGLGAAPDELDRRLKQGEFVMNTGATANNEDMLKEMNRTGGTQQQAGPPSVDAVHAFLRQWLLGEVEGDGQISRIFGHALQGTGGAFG